MANVTYTVPNKSGSYDGDMVVKQFTSMTIDSGDTVTVDAPCRGLFILVQGDCTINGTLSMLGKGAGVDPTSSGGSDSNAVDSNGLRFPFLKSGSSESLTAAATLLNGCGTTARSVIANFRTLSSNGIIKTISRQGNSGGSGRSGVEREIMAQVALTLEILYHLEEVVEVVLIMPLLVLDLMVRVL